MLIRKIDPREYSLLNPAASSSSSSLTSSTKVARTASLTNASSNRDSHHGANLVRFIYLLKL
jgi:hypothetical protein